MKIRLSELKQIIKEEVGMADLVNRLNRVDWDYQMSDDARVYQRGQEQVQAITAELRNLDLKSAEALLADPALRPYTKIKVNYILGRK
jgi:hypothetical protein